MPLNPTDRIISGRTADDRLVVGRLSGPDSKDFAFASSLINVCETAGVDPVLALVQWLLETGNATSPRWNNDLNSSGIGIVANDTAQPFIIPDVNAAAALHVQCLFSLVNRQLHPQISLWPQADAWMEQTWLPKVQSANMPDVRTVGDLGLRYTENGRPRATWSFEDGVVPQDTYGRKLASRGREFYPEAPEQSADTSGPTSTVPASDPDRPIVFGRVPRPAMVTLIVDKPVHQGSDFGYDRAPAPRKNVGLVHHETQGRGTGQFYHAFFSCPDGERCSNALVDFFIDKQGTIFMFNDPFGTRAGWANGGGVGQAGGLEGDGVRFFSVFGANGINFKLVSIEYEKLTSEDFTEAQVQSGGALAAWIHDLDGQPWNEHPFVSKYGCVTSFLHFEFGTTNCGKGEIDDISRVQAVTKGIMRRFQQGGSGDPVQPDVIELPEAELPGGLTVAEASDRFGTYRKHLPDGRILSGGFDPAGIISLAWASRAAQEEEWPRIADWYVFDDSAALLNLVTFDNGWLLVQKSERSGLMWVNLVPVETEAADGTRAMDGAFSRRVLGSIGELRETVEGRGRP